MVKLPFLLPNQQCKGTE